MGVTSMADCSGISTAAISSMFVHKYICSLGYWIFHTLTVQVCFMLFIFLLWRYKTYILYTEFISVYLPPDLGVNIFIFLKCTKLKKWCAV